MGRELFLWQQKQPVKGKKFSQDAGNTGFLRDPVCTWDHKKVFQKTLQLNPVKINPEHSAG